jgi:hypothetical protein
MQVSLFSFAGGEGGPQGEVNFPHSHTGHSGGCRRLHMQVSLFLTLGEAGYRGGLGCPHSHTGHSGGCRHLNMKVSL